MNRKELEEEWSKYSFPISWNPRWVSSEETPEGFFVKVSLTGSHDVAGLSPKETTSSIRRFGLAGKIEPTDTADDMHRTMSALVRALLRYQYHTVFQYDNRHLMDAFDKSPK